MPDRFQMDRTNNVQRINNMADMVVGEGSRTLPVDNSLQTDLEPNHTNGLVGRAQLSGSSIGASSCLSSVSTKTLVRWLATVAKVSTYVAEAASSGNVPLGRVVRSHHHNQSNSSSSSGAPFGHSVSKSGVVSRYRHSSSHNLDGSSPSHVLPFAENATNGLLRSAYSMAAEIVPNSVSVLIPSTSDSLVTTSDSFDPSSSSLASLASSSSSSSLWSQTSPSYANHSILKHIRSLNLVENANSSMSSVLNHTLTANMLVDLNANAAQGGSTSSDNSSTDFYNSSWNIHLIWYTVFGLMISIGLVANFLVLATIGGHKSLHTVTNCFLLNLTVSDLVTLLFNAIFNLVFMLNGHWPFGSMYCVMNNFITNLTIAVSVFTIMFTSKERYNAIVHPLRKRMTKQRAFVHIFIIWLGGTLFAVPTLIFSRTVHIRVPFGPEKGQIQRTICLLKWPDGYPGQSRFDFIYNLLFLVLTYILPLMTMGIAYTLMARVLWGSKQIGESTQAQMNLVCSKQKVVRMLICVVVVFGVCWLPYHVYFLCTYQWPQLVSAKATQHIYLAIYWLAMSNSMLNPIILLLMNRRFRRYSTKFLNFWPFNQMFSCIATSQQSLPSEACNTAIVTHGPNHQETQTVLLCNGLKDLSPELDNPCEYENDNSTEDSSKSSHNHNHNQNGNNHTHHNSTQTNFSHNGSGNGVQDSKNKRSQARSPLVTSMSIRYSP